MGAGKVLARGQVTIPARVRRAAGIRPGDTILFRVTGEGRGEFVVIPTHAELDALWARYRGPGAFGPESAWAEVAEAIGRDVLVVAEPGGAGA
ncbi:MAG: AbrB/MazE/SpoVT family DNA-binding domain-containing protein [Firmicutes bacterium]|nr:AbrB/MazE/SpoVT family DNA-binding domain-containing protein [Bacillota bacterium]